MAEMTQARFVSFVWCLQGGKGTLLSLHDDAVELLSDRAWAPGSRPGLQLDSGEEVRIKVHSCRRQDEQYRIHARTIDLTRGLRAKLSQMLCADLSSQSSTPTSTPTTES